MRTFCFTLNHVSKDNIENHYKWNIEKLSDSTDYRVYYNNSNIYMSGMEYIKRIVPPSNNLNFIFEVFAQFPNYDYYMFLEGDAWIIKNGLEYESIKYMQENNIDCLLGSLKLTGYKDPMKELFKKSYKYDFQYSILSHWVMSHEAMMTLCQRYWDCWTSHCEIVVPAVLEKYGLRVRQSPFVNPNNFKCQRPNDLSDEEIQDAKKNGEYVIHPVRDINNIKRNIK